MGSWTAGGGKLCLFAATADAITPVTGDERNCEAALKKTAKVS
jgi:hypothetical protein